MRTAGSRRPRLLSGGGRSRSDGCGGVPSGDHHVPPRSHSVSTLAPGQDHEVRVEEGRRNGCAVVSVRASRARSFRPRPRGKSELTTGGRHVVRRCPLQVLRGQRSFEWWPHIPLVGSWHTQPRNPASRERSRPSSPKTLSVQLETWNSSNIPLAACAGASESKSSGGDSVVIPLGMKQLAM
jgi:hypothetical protein